MEVTNKSPICLISGCSGYIGRHIASHLILQKWQVCGITRQTNSTLLNPQVNWLKADLAHPENWRNLYDFIDTQKSLNAIIHCLGDSPDDSITNLNDIDFQLGMTLNFSSIQKLNQIFIPLLIKNASIIHFGSRIALVGNHGQIAYGTPKGILTDYTKLLAAELGRKNITVNMILPGVHPSEILGAHREKIMENAKHVSLLSQLTNIEDVVNAVEYLLHAHSVTGQTFAIESRLIE